MSDDENENVPMAECGSCRTIVPLNSDSCEKCGVKFGGVSDQTLGECGSCGALQPIEATSCSDCGVTFVADNVIEVLGKWLNATGISVQQLFEKFDTDHDGEITSEEFKTGLLALKLADLPPSQVERLVEAIDEDGNGTIDIKELTETFGQDHNPARAVEPETVGTEDDTSEEDEESESDETEDSKEKEIIEEDEETESDKTEDSKEKEIIEEDKETESDKTEESKEEEIVEEDKDDEPEEETFSVEDAMIKLVDGIIESGENVSYAFSKMDLNNDGKINGPELQKAIEKIAGDNLSPGDIHAIITKYDDDNNGGIDLIEFTKALEDLAEDEAADKVNPTKEFPTPLQSFLMKKSTNDAIYPIVHFLMVCFVGIWVVNGLGLIVDGTGGPVEYEGSIDEWGTEIAIANWNICDSGAGDIPDPCFGTVEKGDNYPCDPKLDKGNCDNSLTPLSGDNGASSMPAGFYLDGIFMIILGVICLGGSLFLHLIYAPKLREHLNSIKSDDDDSEDETDEEDSEEDEDSADESDSDEDDEDDSDEEDEDDSDEDEEDDSDEDEEDDDGISVGDHIGLEVDGEEFFGDIIKFDDDDETVTIETEDGDKITGDQEDMFLEDDDDEDDDEDDD